MIPIHIAFEDLLSKLIIERILDFIGNFAIGESFGGRGFGYLKNNILKYNAAAEAGTPFLLLTDLDTCSCPSLLISNWLGNTTRSHNLIFRVAVAEVESWLLADRRGISSFLSVSIDRIPQASDAEPDPKRTLVQIASNSRLRSVRDDLTPRLGTTAQVGPNYNSRLGIFIRDHWSIEDARQNSPSLSRTLNNIQSFSPTWQSP